MTVPSSVGKPAWRQIDETYRVFNGKSASARNRRNEVTVRLEGPPPARVALDVSFRAYDDSLFLGRSKRTWTAR